MFSYSLFQPPKTNAQLQNANIVREIQELKESLAKMTPEEQAAFWDDIEGVGDGDTEVSNVQD